MTDRLVVVGASLAGLRAVEAARKAAPDLAITLVGAEPHLPYDRPPLSKAYLDSGADVDGAPTVPTFRDEAYFREELNVELRLGSAAAALLPTERTVGLADGTEIPWTRLVIATGTSARTLPGSEHLDGVHVLRGLEDAAAVRAALDRGARTVVIGGGFIGSEVASAARKRGLSATVLEALPVPLVRSVGESVGRVCTDLHTQHGTDVRCGVSVTQLQGEGSVEKVVLADGTVLPADLVVVGIGVVPCTSWLAGSGVELGPDGAVLCDENLATTVAGVYAAGDAASFPHAAFDGLRVRPEHWTNAAETGALAGRNALDPGGAAPAVGIPYFWSDWYDSRLQFVGTPAAADELHVVADGSDKKFLALYRRADRLSGVFTIDRPHQIMKFRRQIAQRASWSDALEFAASVA